jgi:hypothetical protein
VHVLSSNGKQELLKIVDKHHLPKRYGGELDCEELFQPLEGNTK